MEIFASSSGALKKIAIGALMWNNEYFNPAPEVNFLEPLSPLLSQPIVENCLRIPLYIHQLNGKERGLARRVFAEFLADPVRLRQFKSNGSPFYLEMISTHRKYFLNFLLDGVLAQKNLLNNSEIEKVMMDPSCAKAENYIRISHIANVEAWARAWN